MSLEARLAELTGKIDQLIAALAVSQPLPVRNSPVEAAPRLQGSGGTVGQALKEALAPVKAAVKAAVKAKLAAENSAAPTNLFADPAPAAAAVVTYDEVKEALFRCVEAAGRDAAVEVVYSLGVETAKDLTPEQYAAARDAFLKRARA